LFSDVLTPLCGKRYKDKLKTLEDLKRVPVHRHDLRPRMVDLAARRRHGRLQAQAGADVRLDHDRGRGGDGRGGRGGRSAAALREELAEGRLFQPFPQIVDSGKAWWFVCPPSSASRPKTRAFEEWLVEELSAPPVRSGRPIAVARRSA
jgi:DNA-binding transcriptional LysR family regulator